MLTIGFPSCPHMAIVPRLGQNVALVASECAMLPSATRIVTVRTPINRFACSLSCVFKGEMFGHSVQHTSTC